MNHRYRITIEIESDRAQLPQLTNISARPGDVITKMNVDRLPEPWLRSAWQLTPVGNVSISVGHPGGGGAPKTSASEGAPSPTNPGCARPAVGAGSGLGDASGGGRVSTLPDCGAGGGPPEQHGWVYRPDGSGGTWRHKP